MCVHTQKMVVRIQRDAENKITNQQVICFDKSEQATFFNMDIDTESRNYLEGLVSNPMYQFDCDKKHVSANGSIRVRWYTFVGINTNVIH